MGVAGAGLTFRCCTRKVRRELNSFVHLINSDPGNTEVTYCGSHPRILFPRGSSRQACCSKFLVPFLDLSGPGSSVGIATGYGLDGPGIESRWGRDFPPEATLGVSS